MSVHSFKVGDMVTILSMNLSGKLIVEGRAEIVKLLDVDEYYRVRFASDTQRECYDRFVSIKAQDDPGAYVDKLNAKIGLKENS